MKRRKCPCCGYYTLETEMFEICSVCFWEDDHLQRDNIDYRGGANGVSLREARENYKLFGACDKCSIGSVREPYDDEKEEYVKSHTNEREIEFLEEDNEDVRISCIQNGSLLHYFFIKNNKKNSEKYDLHKNVAIYIMNDLKLSLYVDIFDSFANKRPNLILKEKVNVCPIEIFEKKILGKKISCSKFLKEKNEYERTRNGNNYIWPMHLDNDIYFEVLYSFSNLKKQKEIFKNINIQYLSPFNDENLEIYSWNREWSNYFDVGRKYLGTSYWTIYNKKKDIYVVIVGSPTD